MTFQFTCPQGHLLEGDPAHSGMQSQCPMCGEMFVIPSPPPGVGAAEAPAAFYEEPSAEQFPGIQIGPASEVPTVGEQPAIDAPDFTANQDDPDRIVHIICPNDHKLETPMSMVGEDAMCPHCEAQFRLRYEDSLEYREEKEKERHRREAAFGRSALNWAIVVAVLVFLGLIGLMVISKMK